MPHARLLPRSRRRTERILAGMREELEDECRPIVESFAQHDRLELMECVWWPTSNSRLPPIISKR